MGHGIELIDLVFSNNSTEWHGLAHKVDAIGKEELDLVSFPIIESPVVMMLDGVPYQAPNHKIIAADLRHRVANASGLNSKGEFVAEKYRIMSADGVVPLHTPKEGYRVISNSEIIQSAFKTLEGMGMEVSTVGTLEGGKKFFLSATVKGDDGANTIEIMNNGRKDVTKPFFNFLTSHDGTMKVNVFDSMIRVVCMNTFKWSLGAKGDFGFTVGHTKNAGVAMNALSENMNEILKGRKDFQTQMQMLADIKLADSTDALYWVAGYYAMDNATKSESGNLEITKTQANRASGIAIMAKGGTGNGNWGQSRLDLFNGITDFFTNGDGTGKKSDRATKLYKANFGKAADDKASMGEALFNGDFDSYVNTGKKAFALAMS